MKAKFFLTVAAILYSVCALAQTATYQPNDVVRSNDAPTVHITFDNQAPGAGGQNETLTNVGSTRLFRRLRFESVPTPTDNTQMSMPWIEFVGHYDSNASVGTVTNSTITVGGITATWNSDNTITTWLGGTGAGSAGLFGTEGMNLWPVWQGQASCGSVSKAGRAQFCYNNTTGTFQYSINGGAWTNLSTAVGTVTSVGLALPSIFAVSGSPVTSTGTLTGTLATQTANTIFAGPTSGGAATPTFRAHVAADFPNGVITSAAILDGEILFADWNANACAANQVPARNAGNTAWVCSSPAGTGTVTSVALTAPAEFTVTGSPITGSGTLAIAKASQSANLTYMSPSGGAGVPTFRAITVGDLPAGSINTTWCQWTPTDAQPPATAGAYLDTRTDHLVVDYITTTQTYAYFECNLPSSYDNTAFTVELTWVAAGSIITGNTVLGAAIEKTNGRSMDTAFLSTDTTATFTTNATVANPSVSTVAVTYANAGSPVAGNHVRVRVTRVANSGSDTLAGLVQLIGVTLRK